MNRARRVLSEFRIRGVKTNIPFLENVIAHPQFQSGQATTTLIDTTPELFAFKPRRDRATKLLTFLGNVIVNGNPHAKGFRPEKPFPLAVTPAYDRTVAPPPGTRQKLLELGPKKFAEWTAKQKRLLITDTTWRDAHQSLMATRVRSYDMLACADALARRAPNLFSLEMWGGATFDTAMRFLNEDPWERLRQLRARLSGIDSSIIDSLTGTVDGFAGRRRFAGTSTTIMLSSTSTASVGGPLAITSIIASRQSRRILVLSRCRIAASVRA
jgi:pyruvate carboxylase